MVILGGGFVLGFFLPVKTKVCSLWCSEVITDRPQVSFHAVVTPRLADRAASPGALLAKWQRDRRCRKNTLVFKASV